MKAFEHGNSITEYRMLLQNTLDVVIGDNQSNSFRLCLWDPGLRLRLSRSQQIFHYLTVSLFIALFFVGKFSFELLLSFFFIDSNLGVNLQFTWIPNPVNPLIFRYFYLARPFNRFTIFREEFELVASMRFRVVIISQFCLCNRFFKDTFHEKLQLSIQKICNALYISWVQIKIPSFLQTGTQQSDSHFVISFFLLLLSSNLVHLWSLNLRLRLPLSLSLGLGLGLRR